MLGGFDWSFVPCGGYDCWGNCGICPGGIIGFWWCGGIGGPCWGPGPPEECTVKFCAPCDCVWDGCCVCEWGGCGPPVPPGPGCGPVGPAWELGGPTCGAPGPGGGCCGYCVGEGECEVLWGGDGWCGWRLVFAAENQEFSTLTKLSIFYL